MGNRKAKWLIYTVGVGLIPALFRLLFWTLSQPGSVSLLSATDFIALGLILHISNINEIEHIDQVGKSWKTIHNGLSIIFIALYSAFYMATILSESSPSLIDYSTLLVCVVVLSFFSFLISYAVFDRISKLDEYGA